MSVLSQIIQIDDSKCTNCHACISVCPVKFCIDGSGDKVTINPDLCIGCGKCITSCAHGARSIKDDFTDFVRLLNSKEKIIAIVAPAVAASFEGCELELNTWLKSVGIEVIFDVSFGAELTVKSYLDYIKKENPSCVISQPCPAIVTYIELFRKDLLPYLAPVESPMLHTVKMIQKFYPEYKDYKIVAISPCVAKKREFEFSGFDILNVTMISLKKYLSQKGIVLEKLEKTEYDNPSAERGVLFSTPGGLLETAEREFPGISHRARKIEGVHTIYKYLDGLSESIKKGKNPLLIDCLNCEEGCNGGPGTKDVDFQVEKDLDELEIYVENRAIEKKALYLQNTTGFKKIRGQKKLRKVINSYYDETYYRRTYSDLSGNNTIKEPSAAELKEVYKKMHKYTDSDIINCCACGYNSCEMMAKAIFNGLNKPENCTYFREVLLKEESKALEKNSIDLHKKLKIVKQNVDEINLFLSDFLSVTESKSASMLSSTSTLESMLSSINSLVNIAESKKEGIENITYTAQQSKDSLKETMDALSLVVGSLEDVSEITRIIKSNDSNTYFLSFNASIEAAHAGDAGRGFAIVADEIGRLADTSSENVKKIGTMVDSITGEILNSQNVAKKTEERVTTMLSGMTEISTVIEDILSRTNEISIGSTTLGETITDYKDLSAMIGSKSAKITESITAIEKSIKDISEISKSSITNFDTMLNTDQI